MIWLDEYVSVGA